MTPITVVDNAGDALQIVRASEHVWIRASLLSPQKRQDAQPASCIESDNHIVLCQQINEDFVRRLDAARVGLVRRRDSCALPHPLMFERISGRETTERHIFTSGSDLADYVAALGPVPTEDNAGGWIDPQDESVMYVPLSGGDDFALIDAEDYPLVMGYAWRKSTAGYAASALTYGCEMVRVHMHRIVAMALSRSEVDHANGVKLDNRKSNLRICSRTENARNTKLSAANTSGIKGITRLPNGKWRACVCADGVYHTKTESELEVAVRWMVDKRHELHGEFAKNASTPELEQFLRDAGAELDDGIDYFQVQGEAARLAQEGCDA